MMRKLLGLMAFFCVFWGSPLAAQTAPSPRPAIVAQTPPPDPPQRKYTGYSLSPELYKKAKRLAAIRFAFRIFSFLFSLFALWLTLRLKWSAKFRDWAEAVSPHRALQALVFTPLFAVAF